MNPAIVNEYYSRIQNVKFKAYALRASMLAFIPLVIIAGFIHFGAVVITLMIGVVWTCICLSGGLLGSYTGVFSSEKELKRMGRPLGYYLMGHEHALIMNNVEFTDTAIIFLRNMVIVPYDSIAWVYNENVTQYQGFNVVGKRTNYIIWRNNGTCTAVSNEDKMDFNTILIPRVAQFGNFFIVGYSAENERKYNDYVNWYKSNNRTV